MKIEKARLYIYIYIIIATFFLILFNNVYTFCINELLLLLFLAKALKYDLKHPLVLFLAIFILYQIAFPILNNKGIIIYENVRINNKYYILSWFAIVSFILFFGKLSRINYDKNKIYSDININIIKIVYIVIAIVAIIGSIFVVIKGYSSKYEISQGKSIILTLGNMAYTTLIPITLYFFIGRNIKRRK